MVVSRTTSCLLRNYLNYVTILRNMGHRAHSTHAEYPHFRTMMIMSKMDMPVMIMPLTGLIIPSN